MDETPEFQEGTRAYQEGKTTKDNPYPPLSESHWRWQEGLLGNTSGNGMTPERIAELRQRHHNAILNTATGKALEEALRTIEYLQKTKTTP